VSLPGGTTNHQGAQFKEARIESSDQRNQVNSSGAEALDNVLIEEEERLNRSCVASAIKNGKISMLELPRQSIVQDFVVPMKVDVQGADPENSARETTEIENVSLRALEAPGPIALITHSAGAPESNKPAQS
jgi:hypothetical protein